jgi:multidrug efflux pump subunit AcrB
MNKFWIFFLEKKAFTYLIMTTLVLIGLYSTYLIPKESAPEVIIPVGVVTTFLRGGSAEDVEQLVTNKLEQDIANVENIDTVTSSSGEGLSVITAQFIASADIEKSIQDLKDAVDKAKSSLPDDADEPNVLKINFSDQPVLILSISQDLAPAELTKLGDDLEREIKKVKGVSAVDVTGTRKREVQVVIAKDKLAGYGLSVGQVIGAIQSANASAPIGRITMGNVDYPIKFEGSIDEAEQVQDISLQAGNGTNIYLRDIAFVTDGLESPKTYSRISVDGKPSENALTLSIRKKSGGDVNQVTTAVLNRIEELKKDGGILSGASVITSLNAGEQVQNDLNELSRTGMETVILVMLVLFLTIGWRESIVAGLSIPLSFVIAFIGIYLSGNTINFLSLFSLILAIGILVDSGIVVAEAIHSRMLLYGDVKRASIESIKEYAWPLVAGTMTTVAVFFPLFFLTGIVGKFVQSIPFTIIFVLIASIFVALGMVPILATLLIKNKTTSAHTSRYKRFTEKQEEYFHLSQEWYKKFLGNILLNRKLQNKFLLGLILAFVGSIMLVVFGLVKVEMFPQDDQDFVIISIEKPEGTPLANTDIVVRQVEEILYENKNAKSFVTTVGAGSSLTGDSSAGGANTKVANITVMLHDKDERDLNSTEIATMLRRELNVINDATITVGQGNNGPPSGKPVVIKFVGDNLDDLSSSAQIAENILEKIEGTQDISTSVKDDGTQLEIFVDRAKATEYGLSAASVAQILRTSVSGVTATTIKKQDEDINVLVKVALNENFVNPEDTIKTTLDSIKNLPVSLPGGGSILLGTVLETNVSPSRASISHEDQKRIVTLGSNVKDGANALEIVAAFQDKIKTEIANKNIPVGVAIDYGGENEDIQNTLRDMILALLAGLALMLAILVLEFNSFRYSFYLLMAVPLSLIGVFGGLALTGKSFSFSAMLGFIALAGVIINHAIILLDSILHRLDGVKSQKSTDVEPLADREENKLFDIIVEASAIRLRPIVLTTVTTVVGMIPLAGVSALWGPLAISIMFGLAFAMVLTLILIPMFFYRYPGKRYKNLK